MLYRFDRFEVDDREFRLSEGESPVPVEPKVLRLLTYLIENRNRLVRKQELLDKVWPDAMVTENALTRAVGLLRKALNDDIRIPRFIETVPTAGYRFIAEVTVAEQIPGTDPSSQVETVPVPPARKTTLRRYRVWIPAIVLLILAAGAYRLFFHQKAILTEKDTVVLADFDNSTGDPLFDATLRRGMAVQLDQSPYLSLIDDDRIQQVLQEMGQPADARLTPELAREICERTQSKAVLDGSIAPLGSQYVIGLRARDCQTGKVLAEEQVQAARKEDVLSALGQIAGKFRTHIGESLSTIEKYDTPLADVTTPSLEALKVFSLGGKKASAEPIEAIPFYLRAIEIDPNFAAAYGSLAQAYTANGEPELAAENARKAYDLRKKVSERERFRIEYEYYFAGTGEFDKAVSTLELQLQTYPRDPTPRAALGHLYMILGNNEKAAEEGREALRLRPDVANLYHNLATPLVHLNRLDEAEAVWNLSAERNLQFGTEAKSLYLLAFLKHEPARMAQLAASAMGKRGREAPMLGAEADTEGWYGRLRASRAFTRRAMDSALGEGAKESAAAHQAKAALLEAELGNSALSRADAQAAIKLGANKDVRALAALALAQSGDTASAEKLAAALDKDFPLNTFVQRYWLPTIQGEIAIQRKDPTRAIELLQAASPYDLANATPQTNPSLLPVYARAEAYLMLHDGNHAAAEYQKYIDHFGMVRNAPIGMLARLGLARAYAMQGDTAKARAAYQEFLTTWRGADPDIPILIQAKAEYAKL